MRTKDIDDETPNAPHEPDERAHGPLESPGGEWQPALAPLERDDDDSDGPVRAGTIVLPSREPSAESDDQALVEPWPTLAADPSVTEAGNQDAVGPIGERAVIGLTPAAPSSHADDNLLGPLGEEGRDG